MYRLCYALFGALLVAAAVFAKIETENGVLVLTDDNFDEALEAHPNLLVEMYAPWCGHCKKLQPDYEAAAAKLAEKGLPLAKIDAAEHKAVAQKYGVQGFPTIKYFTGGKGGKAIDYNGGRGVDDFVNYVVKKSGPASKPLASEADIKEFAESADAVVVGFFSDESSSAAKAFSSVANENDDLTFGIVTDASVAKKFGSADGTVAILKKFDEGKAELPTTKSTTSEEISSFVATQSMRLVTQFSSETSRAIFGGPIQTHVLFFAKELEGDIKEAAEEAARINRGKLLHVHVPHTEQRVVEWFGLTEKDMPTIMIADMTKAVKKYAYGDKAITKENVKQFEQDFLDGKLKPSLKSEEPAEEDLAGAVKILKGKSFQPIVIDTDKDVFVKMHAPWCGHCKSLAPKWDELAEKLKDVDSLVIGKMDATANEVDVPGADVEGFPTLLFFPGKDKANPIKYEGAREVDEMAEWLTEHASNKFNAGAHEEL